MGVDIILLGHFSKDKIVLYGKERTAKGGAVYYSSFPVKKMGLEVAVITKLAKEDSSLLGEFKKAGIGVYVSFSGETTSMKHIYKSSLDDRVSKVVSIADPFTIDDIPDLDAKFFHIGALIAGEVPAEIVKKASEKYNVSLDAQGFVRFLEGEGLRLKDWKEKAEVLRYVKVLKVDSLEAEILTQCSDLKESAKKLAFYGPKEVVLTSNKGVLVYANGSFYEAPFKSRKIKGRTGRGDTCIASYLGRRLTHNPEEACKFAAALTSLKMEKPGPFKKNLKKVEKFLKKHY